ncbi:MAG TPA: glycoside hydrolase family 2 TIM barrel-domain containing protein [Verrucomicrobiae bacterium]|nr:glycoside hydrolase family 2 TIM barrel-domain containing protein [Verrucomicrobiae bacterium]
MKRHFIFVCFGLALLCPASLRATDVRTTLSFDSDWRFVQADPSGAEQTPFNDSDWRQLDVPNDWSIAGPYAQTNLAGGAGAFLPSGVAWYRKHFNLPPEDSDRRAFIEFDGVMANSDVWINGFHLGHRPYGYVSFSYELTGHLNFGGDNVLAVRADTSRQPASRWYAGAGIYRHVRLVETSPVYIPQWQTFISTPQVNATLATVHAQVVVTNDDIAPRQIFLNIALVGPDGKVVATAQTPAQTIANSGAAQFDEDIPLGNPRLWDIQNPSLYQARVKVCGADSGVPPAVFDDETVSFGIREFHFDAATGFWLNGRNFKIKGVCLHEEGSAFGTAIPLGVWQERLKTLKSLGVNAIRTAHNPPAPEFLDLCDRMGFLVLDEFFDCWTVGKNPYDYHLYFRTWSKTDERDSILRDRNHPGIILYSVGNEIHDTPHADLAKGILKGLLEVAHTTDPTRPVTQALLRPNRSHDYDDGLADMLDVIGQNYRENEILAAHDQKPSRKIIGTENHPARDSWVALRDHPAYSGQFLWSGIDYLGESRRWPVIAAGSGLLDRTTGIKPIGYEYASWWSDQPMVFMVRRVAPVEQITNDPGFTPLDSRPVLFPDWTPKNPNPHQENVEVYSNCKMVELFLNGKSLGAQEIHADASPRVWQVDYVPGALKAVARNGGTALATEVLRTAGPPARIVLAADCKEIANDWNSVAFVRAEVVDQNGVMVPDADNLISFTATAPGVIAAVDSADNSSHEPFQSDQRRAFRGTCVAYLKANAPSGRITVSASSPGLQNGSLIICVGQ